MVIIQVSYARLYNTGNYENVRFEAVVSVEGEDTPAAFEEAKADVHTQFKQYQADIEAEAQRQLDEWEAERANLLRSTPMTPYHILAHAKAELREAKDHEQTVRAICEHTTPTTGKNETDRKRELTLALSQSDVYGSALRQLREAEAAVDHAQADVEQEEAERRDLEWQIRARLAEALAGRNEDNLPGDFQDRQMDGAARLRIVQSTRESANDLYGPDDRINHF